MSVYVEAARNDQISDREPEAAIAKAQGGSGGPAKMARCLVVIDIAAHEDHFCPALADQKRHLVNNLCSNPDTIAKRCHASRIVPRHLLGRYPRASVSFWIRK